MADEVDDGMDMIAFVLDLTLTGLTCDPAAQLVAIRARLDALDDPAEVLRLKMSLLIVLYGNALTRAEGSRVGAVAWLEQAGMAADIMSLGGEL